MKKNNKTLFVCICIVLLLPIYNSLQGQTFANKPDTLVYVKVKNALQKDWVNSETGDLVLSFMETKAIYKNRIWIISDIKMKGFTGKVDMYNKDSVLTLYMKETDKNRFELTDSSGEDTVNCISSNKMSYQPYTESAMMFTSDTVTYSGCFVNHWSEKRVKSGTVLVHDIISGTQKTYEFTLDENYFFSIRFPVNNPCQVYIKLHRLLPVYVEPGKDIFHVISSRGLRESHTYLGSSGRINTDLNKMDHIGFISERLVGNNTVNKFSPDEYKKLLMNDVKTEIDKLNRLASKASLSERAIQIKKMNMVYNSIATLIQFAENYSVSDNNDIRKVPDNYYDFITRDITNNPDAIIYSGYRQFIVQLTNSSILTTGTYKLYSAMDIPDILKRSNTDYPESDKEIMADLKKLYNARLLQSGSMTTSIITEFNNKYTPAKIDSFLERYDYIIAQDYVQRRAEGIIYNMYTKFGIPSGLTTDILLARECYGLTIDGINISGEFIAAMRNKITIPFISEYIEQL